MISHRAAKPGSAGTALRPGRHRLFVERVLIVAAVVLAIVAAWRLGDLILLLFGSVVTALLLRVAAEPFRNRMNLGEKASVVLAITFLSMALGGMLLLFGRQISAEFATLARGLPEGWLDLRRAVVSHPIGAELLSLLREGVTRDSNVLGRLGDLVLSVSNAVADLILVAIGAAFLAMQPRIYRNGLLKLVPADYRAAAVRILDDGGAALRLWLKAQIISMLVVGALTWLGLVIVGVPAAFALAAIAALAEIIPYAGPILAAVPGVLLALLLGPEKALWGLLVYIVVQQLEGNVIQPLVQRRVAMLPPLVTLYALVAGGLLFGFLGLLFAMPAAVVIHCVLQRAMDGEPTRRDGNLPLSSERS